MKPTFSAVALALAVLSIGAGGTSPARAQGIPVIDTSNLVQAFLDVQNGLDQLLQLKQQLTAQLDMIKALPYTIMPDLTELISTTRDLMSAVDMIQNLGSDLDSELADIFPSGAGDLTNVTSFQDLVNKLDRINSQARRAQAQSMQLQNQISQNQARTASAVDAAVSASQGASGQTAVAQATNQVLAAMSSQLTELQSLTITASRAAETERLERQARSTIAQENLNRAIGQPQVRTTAPSVGTFDY